MNITDIILLVMILVWGVFTGIRKGFVFQITALLSLVLGTYLAYCFASALGAIIAPHVDWSCNVLNIISFIIIFIAVFSALYLVGFIIRKMMSAVVGPGIDKILGVLFSTFKIVLILGLAIQMFDALNCALGFVSQQTMDESLVYVWIKKVSGVVFPYLKSLIAANV